MDSETQKDSLNERKKAVSEVGKQLEPKLPGFFGRIILHFKNGRFRTPEIRETFEPITEERKG